MKNMHDEILEAVTPALEEMAVAIRILGEAIKSQPGIDIDQFNEYINARLEDTDPEKYPNLRAMLTDLDG